MTQPIIIPITIRLNVETGDQGDMQQETKDFPLVIPSGRLLKKALASPRRPEKTVAQTHFDRPKSVEMPVEVTRRENREKALEMLRQGISVRQISETLGVSRVNVYRWRDRFGIPKRLTPGRRTVSGRPAKFTPEELADIQRLRESGMSYNKLASRFQVSAPTMRLLCTARGVPVKT